MINMTSGTTESRRQSRDPFLEMLQGPSVEVIIGTTTSTSKSQHYHLPRALLSAHSAYFRDEIAKLSPTTTHPADFSSQPSTATLTPAPPPEPALDPIPSTPSTSPTINLPDIDPTVFGLFLRFIYQGTYSSSFDQHLPFGPGSTTTTPFPFPNPPSASASPIPLSIRAWTLASHLRAPTFQNHALTHIYNSLGLHFSLTPALVSWVWTHTSPTCALRRLVCDVLAMHWSTASGHVAKFKALEEGWSEVFDEFAELRREFIFGLRGRRVGGLGGYLVGVQATAEGMGTGVKVKKEFVGYDATVLGLTHPSPTKKETNLSHGQGVKIKKEPDELQDSLPPPLQTNSSKPSSSSSPALSMPPPPLAPKTTSPLSTIPFTPTPGTFTSPSPTTSRVRFASPLTTSAPPPSSVSKKRSASPVILTSEQNKAAKFSKLDTHFSAPKRPGRREEYLAVRKKMSASSATVAPSLNQLPMLSGVGAEGQGNGAKKVESETRKEVRDAATG